MAQDKGYIGLDVIAGGVIMLLLLGVLQYTVATGNRLHRLEHRLWADWLLSEQLDMAEIDGIYQREQAINGIMFTLDTKLEPRELNRWELQGICRWQEGDIQCELTRCRWVTNEQVQEKIDGM